MCDWDFCVCMCECACVCNNRQRKQKKKNETWISPCLRVCLCVCDFVFFSWVGKEAWGGKNWSVPPAPFSPARQPPFCLFSVCTHWAFSPEDPVVVVTARFFFFQNSYLSCVSGESGVTAQREPTVIQTGICCTTLKKPVVRWQNWILQIFQLFTAMTEPETALH